MKTNRISIVVRLAVMVLLALGLSAGRASAQDVKGTFTLPFEAHWGIATLAPGTYSFTLDNAGAGGMILLRCRRTGVALIANQRIEDERSGISRLVVNGNAADRSITELHVPGMVLTYAPYRSGRNNRRTEERKVAQVVPVTFTSN